MCWTQTGFLHFKPQRRPGGPVRSRPSRPQLPAKCRGCIGRDASSIRPARCPVFHKMGTINPLKGVPLRLINPLDCSRQAVNSHREQKDRDLEVPGDARTLETNRKSTGSKGIPSNPRWTSSPVVFKACLACVTSYKENLE